MSRLPKRGSPDDYRAFLAAQRDPSLGHEEFAARVCELITFQEKLALAVLIATQLNPNADEAGQRAVLTMYDYLARTRGGHFRGATSDEFASWLYCLARQHIRWALGNMRREERRRYYHEQAAARPLMLQADTTADEGRLAWLVEAVAKLPEELRRIIAAILLGDDVTTICQRLGISRRTFYRLRDKGLCALRKQLNDDNGDDDYSSLVPA